MSIKIPIETSARHIHISKEDFETLMEKTLSSIISKNSASPDSICAGNG